MSENLLKIPGDLLQCRLGKEEGKRWDSFWCSTHTGLPSNLKLNYSNICQLANFQSVSQADQ